MTDALPQPVPGPELAKLRDHFGVRQSDLAARLGVHTQTVKRWERKGSVLKPLRAIRYRRALNEIVAEATGESVA